MARMQALNPAQSPEPVSSIFSAIKAQIGKVPNLYRTIGNAPTVLEGLLALTQSVDQSSLGPQLPEQIALTMAEANGCAYCLAAHSLTGRLSGLTEPEMQLNRRGTSADAKTAIVLEFVHNVVANRGQVADADLQGLRDVGVTDEQLVELTGHIALNLFTNYFNLINQTELDYPPARPLD